MITLKLLNFILINTSLIGSSFFIYFLLNYKKNHSLLYVLLSICVLYFSLVTVIIIGFGVFGMISSLNVSIISYAIFLLLTFVLRKKIFLLKEIKNLIIQNRNKIKNKSNFIMGGIIFAPAFILLSIRFFIALFQIPFEFDSLVYHLPIVTQWLQTGSIMDVYYTAFAGPLAYYPSNFDIFYLWSILPLQSDIFVNLLNFPLFILFSLAIYATSINFGIRKKIALFISAFPLYIPVFMQQAGTVFVDTYFVLTFVLSIFFLQEIAKNTANKLNSILFGLTIGLFIGTKYLGLPYSFIPIVIFLFIHLFQKNKNYTALTLGLFSSFMTGSFFI